jgi:hypothetical protein
MKKNKLGPAQPAPAVTCDESRRKAMFVARVNYDALFKKAVKAFLKSAEDPRARFIPAQLCSELEEATRRYDNLWCSHLKGWTTV